MIAFGIRVFSEEYNNVLENFDDYDHMVDYFDEIISEDFNTHMQKVGEITLNGVTYQRLEKDKDTGEWKVLRDVT